MDIHVVTKNYISRHFCWLFRVLFWLKQDVEQASVARMLRFCQQVHHSQVSAQKQGPKSLEHQDRAKELSKSWKKTAFRSKFWTFGSLVKRFMYNHQDKTKTSMTNSQMTKWSWWQLVQFVCNATWDKFQTRPDGGKARIHTGCRMCKSS